MNEKKQIHSWHLVSAVKITLGRVFLSTVWDVVEISSDVKWMGSFLRGRIREAGGFGKSLYRFCYLPGLWFGEWVAMWWRCDGSLLWVTRRQNGHCSVMNRRRLLLGKRSWWIDWTPVISRWWGFVMYSSLESASFGLFTGVYMPIQPPSTGSWEDECWWR